jgi:hypothetical protein
MRLPHRGQKAQRLRRPSSPRVSQVFSCSPPRVKSTSVRFMISDMPKALDDCFWQSLQ